LIDVTLEKLVKHYMKILKLDVSYEEGKYAYLKAEEMRT